jgi:hypothetical protein
VRNLVVDGVDEVPWFGAARAALIALWAVAAAWALAPLLRRPPRRALAILALLACAGVLAGLLTPQPQLNQTLGPLRHDIGYVAGSVALSVTGMFEDDAALEAGGALKRTVGPRRAGTATASRQAAGPAVEEVDEAASDAPETTGRTAIGAGDPRRAGRATRSEPPGLARAVEQWTPPSIQGGDAHILAFVLLGILCAVGFRDRPPGEVIVCLLLLAVASEVLQSFYDSRETEWEDMVLNGGGLVAGVVAGALGGWLARTLWARRAPAGREIPARR